MKCPNCQFENRNDAKFCKSCGCKLEGLNVSPLPSAVSSPVCPNCGASLKPGAKFCSKCGTMISSSAAPAPEPAPAPAPIPLAVPETEATIPEPEDRTEILVPESAPIPPQPAPMQPQPAPLQPQPAQAQAATSCTNCGAPMKASARFCPVCGNQNTYGNAPVSVNSAQPAKSPKPKKKNALIITVSIILILLVVGGSALFLTLKKSDGSGTPMETIKGKLAAIFNKSEEEDSESVSTEDSDEEDEDAAEEEELPADIEEKLAPITEQITAGKEKMDSSDYAGASSDFTEALNAYAGLAEDYAETVSPLAADTFELYTQSILKQVENWESQPPTAPLYQQIDITLVEASELAAKLQESGLTVNTDALDENYAQLPNRYKEKYIYAFNDLISGSDWSRTTAWMYMQDASSVRLVNLEDSNDPLTLRYAYALAWITQKEVSEGRANGTLSDKDSIDSILAVAKNADYNPALIRELAFCYDAIGEKSNSEIIKKACIDVYNYLATSENIFINAEELFVPAGRPGSSATISLTEFWYFNDFGEYSPASAEVQSKGLSPDGRNEVRRIFKEAINKLT